LKKVVEILRLASKTGQAEKDKSLCKKGTMKRIAVFTHAFVETLRLFLESITGR